MIYILFGLSNILRVEYILFELSYVKQFYEILLKKKLEVLLLELE